MSSERIVFDIGANIGEWVVSNINLGRYDKIITVEASPYTFKKLQTNLSKKISPSLITKIIPVNYAVSNVSDSIKFYHCTNADTISTTNKEWLSNPAYRFGQSHFVTTDVSTVTIDRMIVEYGMPKLIKIDVEGAEFDVIKSLTQKVPMLCYEWASEMKKETIECMDYLETLGFDKFFCHLKDDYTFIPSSWNTKSEVIDFLNKTTPRNEWGMIWAS